MIKFLIPVFAVLVSVLTAFPASADMIAINNAGFEDDVLGPNGFTDSVISGWDTPSPAGTFAAGVQHPTTQFTGGAPEGNNSAYSNGGEIIQVLFDVLEANTEYELSVMVGNRNDKPFRPYSIVLLAGGNVIAVDNNSLSPGDGLFLQSTINYFASASDPLLGQALEIRLIGQAAGGDTQVNFDDVRLSASGSVPEPGVSWMLFAMTGMAYVRRKR